MNVHVHQLETPCKFFVASEFKKSGKCRFATTDPLPMSAFWSVTLQKNSRFTPLINDA